MPLSRRARFNWWIVVVIAALAAPLWMLIGGATAEMRIAAAVQSSIALAAMVWLLSTTPRNAIKLPDWVNLVVLWVGVFWLLFASGAASYLFGPGAKFIMLMFPLVTIGLSGQAMSNPSEHRQYSSWNWAPFLWHPMLWAAPWPRHDEANKPGAAMWIQVVLPLFVYLLLISKWRTLAVPAFALSAALMFAFSRWS